MSISTKRPRRRASLPLLQGMIALCAATAPLGSLQAQSAGLSSKSAAETSVLMDVHEIENLMGRRAYYHSAGRNDLEFALYAKRPDISWGQNQGFMVGPDSIRKYYVEGNVRDQDAGIQEMRAMYPDIPDSPASRGVGGFVMHALSTPVIEIAADGKTAKGMWYTPGALAVWKNGKPVSMWMWEKYAVDFIKEDGQWRFWHILVLTDFMVGMDKDLGSTLQASQNSGASVGNETSGGAPAAVKWDIPRTNYVDWGPKRVPELLPPPVPYRTFSETVSYGPPAK